MMRNIFILLILLFCTFDLLEAQADLDLFATGFDSPVKISHANDSRLFVVERSGYIKILQADGTTLPTPFLDIDSKVYNADGQDERGLLGLAFHPDYAENGYFFVNYTDNSSETQIVRYQVSDSDPNIADPSSALTILSIDQPYANHNGGEIAFGPDGYLYIGMGDGGSANDPDHLAQNRLTMLGKMLRIDINTVPFTIPTDNPFAEVDDTLDEIWAIGLRNPWRFSFDKLTGDLWIADVGQYEWEEIDFQSADSPGGENYGWRCYEGLEVNPDVPQTDCVAFQNTTEPIFQYAHFPGNHCSITGGYVNRSCLYPDLYGYYIYADLCSGNFWGLKKDNSGAVQNDLLKVQSGGWSTFGEDSEGQLYVASLNSGQIFKITSQLKIEDLEINNDENILTLDSPVEFAQYQWYKDDSPIDGAVNSSYEVLESGNYYLVVTYKTGCIYTSNPVQVIISNVQELNNSDAFSIHPNPFQNEIVIETKDSKIANYDIRIFDIDGNLKLNTKYIQSKELAKSIDVSDLIPGIYILELKYNGKTFSQKIVKQ